VNFLDEANMLWFVENVSWRFAKTYAKTAPHEYVVKDKLGDPNLEKMFEQVIVFIRGNGFLAYYKGFIDKYYVLGDYYYWTMEGYYEARNIPLEGVEILNRARRDDYVLFNNEWLWKGAL